jgi:hypothetical protein
MSPTDESWLDRVSTLVEQAPQWLCDLASDELHIGGFTQAQLAHPVIDVARLGGDAEAEQAVIFFVAACLAADVRAGRVQCGRGPRGTALIGFARRNLRSAIERIDGENVALLRYFDVYLKAAGEIGQTAGLKIAHSLAAALNDARRHAQQDAEPR